MNLFKDMYANEYIKKRKKHTQTHSVNPEYEQDAFVKYYAPAPATKSERLFLAWRSQSRSLTLVSFEMAS